MDKSLVKNGGGSGSSVIVENVIEPTKHSACRQFFGGIFFLLIILPCILVFIIITLPLWIWWSIEGCCMFKSQYTDKELEITSEETRKVLFLLPSYGFDPTEVSVPWYIMSVLNDNILVTFATPHGKMSSADKLVLSGYVFGFIKAPSNTKKYCKLLIQSHEFQHPISYNNIDNINQYDGIFIPGGHDPQVISLTKNKIVHSKLKEFISNEVNKYKPIGAICHGVQLLSEADVIRDIKVTSVCSWMERIAMILSFWQYGGYHLSSTNNEYLQNQVADRCGKYETGSKNMLQLLIHGTMDNHSYAFIVEDNQLGLAWITARFPGDAYLIGKRFAYKLYH